MPITPAQTFARLEKAQAAWTRGGATIAVSSVTAQGASRAEFRLDLDGAGGVTLRIKSPGTKSLAPSDQAFVLRKNRVFGIDFMARETLFRPAPDRGPLSLRLAAVLGGIDDAIGFLTTDTVRAKYLTPMKSLDGWKVTPTGLYRNVRSSVTRLDLDGQGRLKGLHVAFSGSRLDWSIVYGPAVRLAVPRGLRPVEAFTARPRPPRYADATARKVVEGMLQAGGRLQNAVVRIDGAATLWFAGSRVRYEGGGEKFCYDGRLLTLSKPGAFYRGQATRGAIIDYAAALLGSVDPLARSVLVRTPPFGELFTPEARVRVVGTMASSGQPCDVLAIDSPRYRASMFVRKADRLPLSIETEALDANGNPVSRTRREFSWSMVGKPLPDSVFQIRMAPGQKAFALPKRKALPAITGP